MGFVVLLLVVSPFETGAEIVTFKHRFALEPYVNGTSDVKAFNRGTFNNIDMQWNS